MDFVQVRYRPPPRGRPPKRRYEEYFQCEKVSDVSKPLISEKITNHLISFKIGL